MTKTIMVSNQKGGVGKTTTTLELGAIYARKGKRVLIIDLDGQVNISMYVNAKYDDKNIPTIRDVLLEIKEIMNHLEAEQKKRMTCKTISLRDQFRQQAKVLILLQEHRNPVQCACRI